MTVMVLEVLPQVIVSLLVLGMALAFVLADRDSPTSRALALFLASIALSISTAVLIALPLHRASGIPWWDGIFAIPEMAAFVFAYEWVLRIRNTVPARNLRTRGADNMLRLAQALAIVYGLASLALPTMRVEHFVGRQMDPGAGLHPVFYVFFVPLAVSLALGIAAGLITLNRRPDRAEAVRLMAFTAAAPFMAAAMVLPISVAPLSMTCGLLILLIGAVQYHVTQGRRAQFMARFLAPQVAAMVGARGLKSATEEKTLEISIVCCDLRGFTAFSAATSSKKVIQILREYYDAVGVAAATFGGTIKDQAGDGVLILVGAPIALPDHATRALALAKLIRQRGIEITKRWSDADLQLGVGVGVASGYVTVGVIGSASRLEYTAVGPAVNLAARLCSEAAHAQILVDPHTIESLKPGGQPEELQPGDLLRLKGFQQPVQSYVLGAT